MNIKRLVGEQKGFYRTGRTLGYGFRLAMLNRLEQAVRIHEESIRAALQKDLGKPPFESYMSEIGMVYAELSHVRKHLRSWMKPQFHKTPAAQFPARSFSVREPYGVVLVMAPWNYPFMLSMEPLIGAIAGGNCCVVKPSAYAPSVSAVLRLVAQEAFPEKYVAVAEGGRAENAALLEEKFDYIFFTGSVHVGRLVMERAAKHLTPVTLELGGKSPCIVEKSANLNLAAKRIAFGKFLNSGQTCVAPDYVYVEECVRERFLKYLKKWIRKMYGEDALRCGTYTKMINRKHFDRVLGLIRGEETVCGGNADAAALKIAPTVLSGVTWDSPVMQEEIFGPVLPVLSFTDLRSVKREIESRPKPLALYLFTGDKKSARLWIRGVSFGGGCINDTIIHLATSELGFGGVGQSGMGSYHGRKSFETFTHEKSMVEKSCLIDLPVRYQPYTRLKEGVLRCFLR